MDSVDIQGKKYISSKRASKITGYAQDYIGQLARGGKVDATRIGRGWYVSERDILKHSGKDSEQSSQTSSLIENTRKDHSLGPERPLKSLHSLQNGDKGRNVLRTWSSVEYFSDSSDLMPNVVKKNTLASADKTSKNIAISAISNRSVRPRVVKTSDNFDGVSVQKTTIKRPERVTKRPNQSLPWAIIGMNVSIAVLLIFSLTTGFNILSEQHAMSIQLGNAYSIDFSIVSDYFKFILIEGFNLIKSFLGLLLSSLEIFFIAGFDFIVDILNIG